MPPSLSLRVARDFASTLHRHNKAETPPTTLRSLLPTFDHTKRQQQQQPPVDPRIIPAFYAGRNAGPSPGVVVAIVIGSVVGFILIAWLLQTLISGGSGNIRAGEEEIVVRRPSHSHSGRHSHHSRRSTRSDVRDASRSPRRSHIIVDERPPPKPRNRSIIVEERHQRRVPNDDIIEVEEFGPRRQRPGRNSRDYR